MKIVSVRENPEFADEAVRYVSACWPEVPPVLYEDCIRHAVGAAGLLPQWYLLVADGEIGGCAGLITNDFISRMDLWPWACALYVDERLRGHAYGRSLLERAAADARRAGFRTMYLRPTMSGFTRNGDSAISGRAIIRGTKSRGFTDSDYNGKQYRSGEPRICGACRNEKQSRSAGGETGHAGGGYNTKLFCGTVDSGTGRQIIMKSYPSGRGTADSARGL